jgi:septum formation protein
VLPSSAPEIDEGDTPAAIVLANARRKRDDVASRAGKPAVVIAADTLVFLDEQVLSKPRDLEEARAMLRRLSGRTHQVITGVAVIDTGTDATAEGTETSHVTFRALSEEEIGHFVHAVRPVDRAGAYTVDGPGSLLVERYEGCFQNVLGLPIVRLDRMLREVGYNLFDLMDARKSVFL